MVNGDHKGVALHHRLGHTEVERLVIILAILAHRLRLGAVPVLQGLVASLIQEIGTAKTDKKHLQQGITDEHSGKDGSKGHHVITKLQVTGLTSEHPYQHIGQHGQHIAEVLANITEAIQPEGLYETSPTTDGLNGRNSRLRHL